MKYPVREFGRPPEVDWTPMIDMTFQLIAFFMFTLSFADADINEKVRLPSSELARPPDQPLNKPLTLQLAVPRDDNGNRLPGPPMVLYGGQEMSIRALGRYLANEADVLTRQGVKPQDATVVIRADADAPGGDVRRLIKLCQDAQFEKFVLRAKEERR